MSSCGPNGCTDDNDVPTKCYAPWTHAQVECLKARQGHPMYHPYTCGNDSNHKVLVPTTNGWVCEDCDYTQNWFLITELGFFANKREDAHG